jgi:putative selenate reductase
VSGLVPHPFETLLARALAEHAAERSVFGLPRRSFWRGAEGLDLSRPHVGGPAGTPLGIAAGPHTQLAHNIVVGWLAGARVIELKTVQVRDRLEIPRPCIEAPDVGYNVEWSQELPIEESARQYAAAWALVHVLHARGIPGSPEPPATRFDASVGYDLAGLRSDKVARFLDTLCDAGRLLAALRDRLPRDLRAAADVEIPARIVDQVTLSTFHGCPPEEIEAMVEHLFHRHRLHVTVKFNPTLLGYEAVERILHGRLGYREIALDREAFDRDLGWETALGLFGRLAPAAARAGLTLSAKFSNTLVVRNTRGRLAGDVVYLSGPPLYPIALALAARFAEATAGRHAIAFSGGVDAENFADTVACGLAPVTVCTDLLKPTGYRRLPRYLKALAAEMTRVGARDVPGLIAAHAGAPGSAADAAVRNLSACAARAANEPRYRADARAPERARPATLRMFDCESCNHCTLVCPNGAFFSVPLGPLAIETWDLVAEGGTLRERPARFELAREEQWALYAGFCNECGNCDPFCPERGGPYRAKPRLYDSRTAFDGAAPGDGILIEARGRRVAARLGGVAYRLERGAEGTRFTDGVIEVTLDADHRVTARRLRAPAEGHTLPLGPYHALRLLSEAVLRGINPMTAALSPAGPEARPAPAAEDR